MKKSYFTLVILILFIAVLLLSGCSKKDDSSQQNITEETPEEPGPRAFAGIMSVPIDDFDAAIGLGPKTLSLPSHLDGPELELALDKAKQLGINLAGRAQGRSKFELTGKKIDEKLLKEMTEKAFKDTEVASDKSFKFHYFLDEPCHKGKWNLDVDDMKKFYSTIKEIDPEIPVMVNFGNFNQCLDSFMPKDMQGCADWKIADIAASTITQKKLEQEPDYLDKEMEIARRAKQCNPSLKMIILIAVYEYPEKQSPLPSANWVRDTGMEVLRYKIFDGIMYYPWQPSSYMGKTIKDVAQDPLYNDFFNEVFQAASEE